MDHSVRGYFQRQSTQRLQLLLNWYTKEDDVYARYFARMIRQILRGRDAEAQKAEQKKEE